MIPVKSHHNKIHENSQNSTQDLFTSHEQQLYYYLFYTKYINNKIIQQKYQLQCYTVLCSTLRPSTAKFTCETLQSLKLLLGPAAILHESQSFSSVSQQPEYNEHQNVKMSIDTSKVHNRNNIRPVYYEQQNTVRISECPKIRINDTLIYGPDYAHINMCTK